jgi:hypothetical protein
MDMAMVRAKLRLLTLRSFASDEIVKDVSIGWIWRASIRGSG